MVNSKVLLCVVLIAVWQQTESASVQFLRPGYIADASETVVREDRVEAPALTARARVREGVPPPLCAVHCAMPTPGPVCAFDAAGTARTFATLCELEAASCRESTYYAISSLGEC